MYKAIRVVDINGKGHKCDDVAKSPDEAILNGHIRLISRVVIKNNKGLFLLSKRAKNMRSYPSAWETSAGGHVDIDETPLQAAKRELQEEIGIKNIEIKEVGSYYSENTHQHASITYVSKMYNHVFVGEYNGDINRLKLQESEVEAVKWYSALEIAKMLDNTSVKTTDGLQGVFDLGIIK